MTDETKLSFSHLAQDAKVTTFALKMRVNQTHVVQQVEEFLVATTKALDKIGKSKDDE